ncbi:MAG: hypothetical protein J0I41_00150 [Filimonas sp.]|nr:hypothetical protein [Filimonas sp.]
MIIIDKNKDENRIIVTVSEMTTIDNPYYLLVLYSPYLDKSFRIQLPANSSSHKERYDAFILPSTVFKNYTEGRYTYSIYQSSTVADNESLLGMPVETGFLTVVGTQA